MAERKIRANYVNMIDSMTTFCTRVGSISDDIRNSAVTCQSVLGEEDSGIQAICAKVQQIQQRYSQLVEQARDLKDKIQEDLDRMDREQQIWND